MLKISSSPNPHSLFVRLPLLFGFTGIVLYFAIYAFCSLFLNPENIMHPMVQKNVSKYVEFLINNMGNPPEKPRAQKLTDSLGIHVRVQSPDGNWSTADWTPPIGEIRPRAVRWETGLEGGSIQKSFFVIADKGELTYLFFVPENPLYGWQKKFRWILLATLVVALGFLLYSVHWSILPLKWLAISFEKVQSSEFRQNFRARNHDELGEIAHTLNALENRITELQKSKDRLLKDFAFETAKPVENLKSHLGKVSDPKLQEGISKEIEGLEKLSQRLLASARIQNASVELKFEVLPLFPLVKEVVELYSKDHPGVMLKEPATNPVVRMDSQKISSVLRNLLENALHYSSAQTKPVEVQINEDEDSIVLSIQDHGMGIPSKDLPFIFEAFYRVDKSRSSETGGLGLGLHLCKNIMIAHGGEVELLSEEGRGTTAFVIFRKNHLTVEG